MQTFAVINDLALPSDSIWFRKSNFFTLVVEIAIHIDDLPPNLDDRLTYLEDNIMTNRGKLDNEFGQYYSYMYQATHGRKARVVRGDVFRRNILAS